MAAHHSLLVTFVVLHYASYPTDGQTRQTNRRGSNTQLARTILSSLGALPRPLALAVGLSIGRLGYLLPGNLRRTGERNLGIAFPEMNEQERRRLLSGCFASLGRLLGEF